MAGLLAPPSNSSTTDAGLQKHYLWKERLRCRVVTYYGHLCKEATDRGTISQLFRQVLDLFPTPPLDDVAPSVGEFKRHCRFVKVQQQGHFPSGPCLLAQPLAPLPGQCCLVRWWGQKVSVYQVPPNEHSSHPKRPSHDSIVSESTAVVANTGGPKQNARSSSVKTIGISGIPCPL